MAVTRVATVGYQAAGLVLETKVPVAFGNTLLREDLDGFAELAAEETADGSHFVVLHPRWRGDPTLRRIQTIRSSLDTVRLVSHRTSAPPLAGAVLGALATALAPQLTPAGLLLAALPLLQRQLLTLTWLDRVTGLREPAPTVWQHLASWWPGTTFAVTSWPGPEVRVVRGTEPLDLPRPRSRIGVVIAAREGDGDWVRQRVLPALGFPLTLELPASPLGPEWWGTPRLVETVVYPMEIDRLAEVLRQRLTLKRCAWCGEQIASSPCPFCGIPAVSLTPSELVVSAP